jgi:hypothetical protein
MRSMIPRPSRRAASSTSESRRPIRAARTRTWRISLSSIESVVFTFPISPYCHTEVGTRRETWYQGRQTRLPRHPLDLKTGWAAIATRPRSFDELGCLRPRCRLQSIRPSGWCSDRRGRNRLRQNRETGQGNRNPRHGAPLHGLI